MENKNLEIRYWHGSVLPGFEDYSHGVIIPDNVENRMKLIDKAMLLTYGIMFKKYYSDNNTFNDNLIIVWIDKYRFGQR